MSNLTRTLFWAAAFSLLGAACSSSTDSATTAGEDIPVIAYSNDDEEAVRVGVLSIRSAVAASAQYGPILEYLESELGMPFTLVPLNQEEQFEKVEADELDFVFSNPLASVQLQRVHNTQFLATLSRINTGPQFSGLIISRADSGIETAEDLQDKRVTCVAFQTAAAGCNFQVLHLREQGVNVEDFASFTETPSQDNIVLAVLNGSEDVGFIRSGQLEKMVAEGTLISLDELQVVDEAADGFFFRHSTRLYPEWPFAALSTTEPALADAVQEALLGLDSDHPALDAVKSDGFVAAVDYSALDHLVIELELRGWDAS